MRVQAMLDGLALVGGQAVQDDVERGAVRASRADRPERGQGYGGTADVVAYAERTGIPVRVLWPKNASR
ncbi:hypothetical protein BIV25_20075 [Streptomyces sp. MUSC 14]|nr:hypothetical protein BIV25_20075 [Streptomyces sp. MUSC 14]